MGGRVVVDAQPLVALIAGEPCAGRVQSRLADVAASGDLLVSAVNWCEVAYMARRRAGEHMAARVVAMLESVPISVVAVDADIAGFAAAVKAAHGLGLGDAFAAGLAIALDAPLLTGDRDFLPLRESGLQVEWLG
ncbi:MAG: PIN domain-containing protein [Actinomycetota bacterium]|nr:PIN domain-containing protein [Actinomycetota bacterium]